MGFALRHTSLKLRISGAVLLMFVGSIWVMTFLMAKKLERDMIVLLEGQQRSAVSYIAADIESKITQRTDLLTQNARLIGPIFHSPSQIKTFLKDRIGLQALFQAGLIVIDRNGKGIAGYPSGLGREGAIYNEFDAFQGAMSTGRITIGQPRVSRFMHKPIVPIVAPIRDSAGEIIGVLAGFATLSDESLFGQVERGTETKDALILVSSPRHELIVSSSDPAYLLQPYPSQNEEDGVAGGSLTPRLGLMPQGGAALVTSSRVPSADWVVQMLLPEKAAFAPIREMEKGAYGIASVLILLAIGGVWLVVRRALRPLERATARIHEMATNKGGLSFLPLLGGNEIRELAQSFNRFMDERQLYEAALRASEERLLHAERVAKSGNWELHLDSRTIVASEGAARIYGLEKGLCDYARIKDARLSEYHQPLDAALKNLIDKDEPYDIEFKIRALDSGEIKDIHSVATFDPEKRIVFGIIQDVSDRAHIQRKLAAEALRRRLVLEKSRDGLVLLRSDGSVAEFNPAFAEMLGYPPDELMQLHVWDWDAQHGRAELEQLVGEHGLQHIQVETRHRRKDGACYDVEVSINGVDLEDGRYLFCLHRDISARKTAEAALRVSEARFRAIIEASPIPYALNDDQLNVTYLNEAFVRTFGYTQEDIPHVQDWWPKAYPDPEYRQKVMGLWQGKLANAEREGYAIEPIEVDIRTRSGEEVTALVAVAPLGDASYGMHVVSFFDITARKRAEEKLRLAATVFSHAREGIMITSADGTILDANGMFSQLTGYGLDEVRGKNPRLLGSGYHDKTFYAAMWSALREQGHWSGEIWNRHKNGKVFAEMLTISAVRDREGQTQQYVALFSDITSIKEHERQLERMAHYDVLTNLPNRALLSDRLHQAMAQAVRRKSRVAVCYLDLDGFKAVNDQHGHKAGDQLLITLAARMKQVLRESDTLARIGGDEFVVLLLDLSEDDAHFPILDRLLAVIAEPVLLGDLQLQVSASLGVTYYPQQLAVDADQLLRQADHAMYHAKQTGKNRYCLFTRD